MDESKESGARTQWRMENEMKAGINFYVLELEWGGDAEDAPTGISNYSECCQDLWGILSRLAHFMHAKTLGISSLGAVSLSRAHTRPYTPVHAASQFLRHRK